MLSPVISAHLNYNTDDTVGVSGNLKANVTLAFVRR